MTVQPCPCGSQRAYENCCEPCHHGDMPAATAEALMRSRYSAFVKHLADYLIQTHHPSQRQADDAMALAQNFRDTAWLGLTVLECTGGSERDTEGTVTFVARYRANGKEGTLHERSRFVKQDGHWLYLDGEMLPLPNPGRNDPCWCGSGRKFKKCHG